MANDPLSNWVPGTSPLPSFASQGSDALIGSESITPGTLQPVQYGGQSITNFAALLPNYTSFPSNPSTGDVIYRSDQNLFYMYDGSGWVQISLQNLDQIANGSTYGKVLLPYLASGVPYNNQGAWSSATSYVIGDEVTYGGNYWLAVANNSNSTPATSNANWQIMGPVTLDNLNDGSTYARIFAAGITSGKINLASSSSLTGQLERSLLTDLAYVHQSNWNSATTYLLGDVVVYSGNVYLCIVSNSNSAPPNSNWQLIGPQSLDNVTDGSTYARILAAGISSGKINLASSGSLLGQLERGFLTVNAMVNQSGWSSATAYSPGDTVIDGGNSWLCLLANTNSEPTTSNTNWQLIGPATLDDLANGTIYGRPLLQSNNLVPDSEFKFGTLYWTLPTDFSVDLYATTSIGAPALQYGPGTGSAMSAAWATSATIPVTPGTYTISGWIDCSQVTVDAPYWGVWDTGITTSYGGAGQLPGQVGRVSGTVTIPSGVTEVVVIFDNATATINSGQYIYARGPQLTQGANLGVYVPNEMDLLTGSPRVNVLGIQNGSVTATSVQENTSSQTLSIYAIASGTTPPTITDASLVWNTVASVTITTNSTSDDIDCFFSVRMNATNFYNWATQTSLTGSGGTTPVNDLIYVRLVETNTSYVVHTFTQNAMTLASTYSISTNGTMSFAAPFLFTGFYNITLALEIAPVDMTSHWKSASALAVTVTDAYLKLTDLKH